MHEFPERGDGVHLFSIGFIQGKGEVNAVHDRIVGTDPVPDFSDDFKPELLGIRVASQKPSVKRRICKLFQQISLVSMEVYAVKAYFSRVGCRLPAVVHDFSQAEIRKPHTWKLRNVEVWI